MAKANFVSVRAGEPLPVPSTAPTAAFASVARIAAPAFPGKREANCLECVYIVSCIHMVAML